MNSRWKRKNYRSGVRLLALSLLFVRCAGPGSPLDSELLTTRPSPVPTTEAERDTAENPWSLIDRYVLGTADAAEVDRLKAVCRAKRQPYCFLLKKEKKLARFRKKFLAKAAATPIAVPRPEPVIPEWNGTTILNMKVVRKAKVQALLQGMQTFPPETLRAIGTYALRQKRCPDPLSTSTAASLESFVSEGNHYSLIADLYEKAGTCAPRHSADREHFFTRAGLLRMIPREYAKAARAFEKAPVRDALSGRALFWHRRALIALGQPEKAERVGQQLLRRLPFSFHAILLRSLQQKNSNTLLFSKDYEPASTGDAGQAFLSTCSGLAKQGYPRSSDLLIRWAVAEFKLPRPVQTSLLLYAQPTSQVLVAGGALLTRKGKHPRALWELAYPKAYWELFSVQKNLDPFFLLAVARKESLLDPEAVSRTQAQGLLQIQPTTASRLKSGTETLLKDPKVNAQVAGIYFGELLARFQNQIPLAIAAYNAGEEAVERWTARYPLEDMLLFLDLIPYRETRDYVASVLSNYFWYRSLYQDAPPPLADLVMKSVATNPQVSRKPKSIDPESVSPDALLDPIEQTAPPSEDTSPDLSTPGTAITDPVEPAVSP